MKGGFRVKVKCDGCQLARINGVLCHETGCSEAWRDEIRECGTCGSDFEPQYREQRLCAGDNCEMELDAIDEENEGIRDALMSDEGEDDFFEEFEYELSLEQED